MAFFAYRILPPSAEFWDTLEPGDMAPLVHYLEHLRRLRVDGNRDFILIEADDEIHADAIARNDPAVSEGLMQIERHSFLVTLNKTFPKRPDALDAGDRSIRVASAPLGRRSGRV